ncbi:lipopolysaccharide kinase InaA family protein [Aestuariirhabdus litorea]|uniref:Heptose kinase n=1 Tax=Aestuariirhabdus litorea TaxID=2528527 RepID=A0A3P3VJ28_9GAMM|nr:lipopolysaccharide kinase InaA family protein [Aestuariirhabdus litorea]RRJ82357.1 heptose kinase [Aestuariirhabdus litorea]RWW92521.1 heptose kinase [Endozoicomonadaceae bacterium GTF-13]
MTNEWTVTPEYRETEAGSAFDSLEKVFALEGEAVASDGESCVFPFQVGGRRYYVKRYHTTKGLRSYLWMSRISVEWRNQLRFLRWGIPAARVVAYGQCRLLGKTVRGALVTEALENTKDLAALALEDSPLLSDARWVNGLVERVAAIARTLHSHGFAHNDLKWRNILVRTEQGEPEAYLIDCPAGQRWCWPFLEYRIIKDLACLDKVAKYHLSRTQRLRFYLRYAGRQRLNPQDRRRVRRVLGFFSGRE